MVKRDFEVSIPKGLKVHGARVVDQKYYGGKNHRTIIGWVSRDGYMYPNNKYFERFQDHWKEQKSYRCDMVHQASVSVGLMALILGIGYATGLYPILLSVYGSLLANGIMDFCMYCIKYQSNVCSTMEARMRGNLMFSLKPYSDSWYSNVFVNKMAEFKNNYFRAAWLKHCIDMGITEVYISVDGTNFDNEGKNNLAEHGKSKSGSPGKIISMIWIVCASGEHKGLPLTYFVTEGNVIDCKAMKKILVFLKGFGLKPKGLLADRGFCTKDVIEMLQKLEIDFVIMMTSKTAGYKDMLNEYGVEVRENVKHALTKDYMFGTSVEGRKLFESSEAKGTIAIFYNAMKGVKDANQLLKEVRKEVERLNKALESGESPTIKEEYKELISISNNVATQKLDEVQAAYYAKGYSCICTGTFKSAETIDNLYDLRDASEKVFSEIKTQLGFGVVRGKGTVSVLNRLFACFIAAILRSEIVNACKEHNLDTNVAIANLSNLKFIFNGTRYEYGDAIAKKWQPLFTKFKINDDSLRSLEPIMDMLFEVEEGKTAVPMARVIKEKRGRGKPKSKSDEDTIEIPYQGQSIGGLVSDLPDPDEYEHNSPEQLPTTTEECVDPDNRLNVEIVESEQPSQAEQVQEKTNIEEVQQPIKRKRGRPRGTGKTADPKQPGPGRGRKLGSKNKSTLERERLIAEGKIPPKTPKKGGRPKSEETIAKELRLAAYRETCKALGIELPDKLTAGRPKSIETLLREKQNTDMNKIGKIG